MTPSDSDRLDRLEALAETTLLAVHQLSQNQERLQQNQERLQNQLTDEITDVVRMIGTLGEQMGEMHTEIRSLQVENRRILAYLFKETEDNTST